MDLLARVRGICLALPEVTERPSHGAPTWFVRDRQVFVTLHQNGHHQNDFPHLWCAAPPGAQEELVAVDGHRFFRPPYVGGRGWLGLRLDGDVDWAEVAELCRDAYRVVAPKRLAASLTGTDVEFVDLDGVRLAVSVTGRPDGTPLILLHGGGNDRSSWDVVAPEFGDTHRVYAVDLRGHGASDRPGAYSFELMRDDVLRLLDRIGADRVDLIGHSMGGTVAWLVAEAKPDRIRRLVVEDTAPARPGARRFELGPRPAEEPPFDWAALEAIARQLNDPDPTWWELLPQVTAPTLVVAGGPASHVPQHLLAEAVDRLPDGRLVEIPVGHRVHRDAPEEFLAAVLPFLGAPWEGAEGAVDVDLFTEAGAVPPEELEREAARVGDPARLTVRRL